MDFPAGTQYVPILSHFLNRLPKNRPYENQRGHNEGPLRNTRRGLEPSRPGAPTSRLMGSQQLLRAGFTVYNPTYSLPNWPYVCYPHSQEVSKPSSTYLRSPISIQVVMQGHPVLSRATCLRRSFIMGSTKLPPSILPSPQVAP